MLTKIELVPAEAAENPVTISRIPSDCGAACEMVCTGFTGYGPLNGWHKFPPWAQELRLRAHAMAVDCVTPRGAAKIALLNVRPSRRFTQVGSGFYTDDDEFTTAFGMYAQQMVEYRPPVDTILITTPTHSLFTIYVTIWTARGDARTYRDYATQNLIRYEAELCSNQGRS